MQIVALSERSTRFGGFSGGMPGACWLGCPAHRTHPGQEAEGGRSEQGPYSDSSRKGTASRSQTRKKPALSQEEE